MSRAVLWRVIGLAIGLAVVTIIGYRSGWFDLERLTALFAGLRAGKDTLTAAAIFVLVYAIAVAVGFPALPFTIAGGAIFGFLPGAALSATAAVAGSALGYLIARKVGRESTRRWLTRKAVGAALTKETSFYTLLRIRLVPIVPLSVVNFAAGLARMRFTTFAAATALGILPVTLVFAYFANSLVVGLASAKAVAYRDVAIASGAMLVMSLVPMVAKRRSRRAGRDSKEIAGP